MLGLIQNIEVADELCDIQIDEHQPGDPGFFHGHPDNWEPEQPPYLAFTVLHPSTGQPWPELQASMTAADEAQIETRIVEHLEAVTN